MKRSIKNLIRIALFAAASGTSHGFVTRPPSGLAMKATVLQVWNPFVKEEAVTEEVVFDPEPGPLEAKNYVAGAVWIAIVTFAYGFAPGDFNSPADTELLTTLISQPTPRPESINEIWFAIWNCFTVVPALLAALEAPVGRGQRLPAAPFLWGSAAFGYFSLGPYFSTRTTRTDPVQKEELGWASKNIFENRLFGVALFAIATSIPFTSGILNCDLSTSIEGFSNLAQTSRFVSVASADITVMSLLAAVLVSEDATRRGWEDKAVPFLVASILLPVITPTLYLAVRPSLDEK